MPATLNPENKKALLRTDPDLTYNIAKMLRIVQHDTGVTEKWQPNFEQYKIWRALQLYQMIFILKVRQIGASTATVLDDLLWVAANDAAGEEVACGVYIDTDKKALKLKRKAVKFAKQLGIKWYPEDGDMKFPNGSTLVFASAGGKRAGASLTYQRLHLTELPFWRDANNTYNAIMQSLVLDGQCIIETTMGLDDPVAMELWTKENDYVKLFFPFEEHLEYQADNFEDRKFAMSPEEEEWLRDEGFTNEASMRYWLYLLRNKSANDVHKNFREYPQKPEHAYLFAEGRYCNADPRVLEPVRTEQLPGIPGQIKYFSDPRDKQFSHQVIIGVDTAAGLGRDNSAVCVVDGRDKRIIASYVCDVVKTDALAQVAAFLQKEYTFRTTYSNGSKITRVPPIRVENNGVGRGTMDTLFSLRAVFEDFSTDEAYRVRCMERTARNIESGVAYGPAELAFEAKQLRTKKGNFLGYKDLFITTGFCYDWLEKHPFKELPPDSPENIFDIDARTKKRRRR